MTPPSTWSVGTCRTSRRAPGPTRRPVGADAEVAPRPTPELLDIVPRDNRKVYDMRRVLDVVFDRPDWLEVQPRFGRAILCALAHLGGHPVAVVANQPMVRAGSIDADAADKAAHFISVADSFHLPIVFLADNPGMLPGSGSERRGVLRSGGRMFVAQTVATTPKIHLTLRKAYGFGSMVMALIGFDGQVATFAYPGATLGAMGAGAMSRAMGADDDTVAKLRSAELEASYRSAEGLGFDELLDPRETRDALLDAVERARLRPPGRARARHPDGDHALTAGDRSSDSGCSGQRRRERAVLARSRHCDTTHRIAACACEDQRPRRAPTAAKSAGLEHRAGQAPHAFEHLGRSALRHAAEHLDAVLDVHGREHDRQRLGHLVGWDRPDDRLMQAQHRLEPDGRLERRHDLPLLDVLVDEVGAGERGELDVEPVQAARRASSAPGCGDRRRLVRQPRDAGLERGVVDLDALGQVRQLALEHGLDGGVLVLGVVDQQGHDGGDVAGERPTAEQVDPVRSVRHPR